MREGDTVAPVASDIAQDLAAMAADLVVYDMTKVVQMVDDADPATGDISEYYHAPDPGTLWVVGVGTSTIWLLFVDIATAYRWVQVSRGGGGGVAAFMGQHDGGSCPAMMWGSGLVEAEMVRAIQKTAGYANKLLTCVNVTYRTVRPPRQWLRSRQRGGHPLLAEYRVVDLHGKTQKGRDMVATVGDTGGTRLHMVRGHFKRKHGKLWWWHRHLRGRPDKGIVVKDYRVDPEN